MQGDKVEQVERWLEEHLLTADPVFDDVEKAAREAGLPDIEVTPLQGAFLATIVRAIGARHVLELGSLAGYSTIWLARAMPEGGRLTTIEYNPRHAEVARANYARAGLGTRVDLRVGAALDILPQLVDERGAQGLPAFDFIFIDADKENYAAYADWAANLLRPGGVMAIDNVVRHGTILDPEADSRARGTRSLFAALRMDRRFEGSALQTVGSKGWDGLLVATRR